MPWDRRIFKGTPVWAELDAKGAYIVRNGLVLIKYSPTTEQTYQTRPERLEAYDPKKAVGKQAYRAARAKVVEDRHGIDPASDIIVYTDGACTGNPGPAGSGVVIRDGETRRTLKKFLGHSGTNNIAELTAIQIALEAIPAAQRSRPIRILTDSEYAIGVLTKGWKVKANKELVIAIRALIKDFPDVKLHSIRGHADMGDNERADQLARAAIEEGLGKPSKNLSIEEP